MIDKSLQHLERTILAFQERREVGQPLSGSHGSRRLRALAKSRVFRSPRDRLSEGVLASGLWQSESRAGTDHASELGGLQRHEQRANEQSTLR